MVLHICEKCNKNFDKKSNYLKHVNKKFNCIKNIVVIPTPPIIQNLPPIIPANPSKLTCIHCNREFKRSDYLKKHLDERCKVKKQNDINIEKQNLENIELKNKLVELEKKIELIEKNNKNIITNNTNTNTNCNNTTNNITNNINIANFGTLDHKKIDNKVFYNSLIKYSGLTPLLKFIEYVHKNDKLPEYKNVEITDLARNLGKFIEDNKWKLSDANEIVDKVIDETYNYYEVKFNELEEEIDKKPQTEKTKIKRNKRFINTMRGNEHFEQNDDGDFVDDDGKYVTVKDFQEGRKFEDKLKKKVKCSLKK